TRTHTTAHARNTRTKHDQQLAHYGSVRDLLVRHTRLPMALLLSLAIDAAEGLQFLHGHHIPHKNIAGTATFSRIMTGPTGLTECCAAASVMVSHGRRGMLSDFGLTRVNAHTRVPCPYGALGLERNNNINNGVA